MRGQYRTFRRESVAAYAVSTGHFLGEVRTLGGSLYLVHGRLFTLVGRLLLLLLPLCQYRTRQRERVGPHYGSTGHCLGPCYHQYWTPPRTLL
eukprot:3402289-Rhodomonas_salina.1